MPFLGPRGNTRTSLARACTNVLILLAMLVPLLVLASAPPVSAAISVSGVINTYAPVTGIAGNAVTIGATTGAGTPFAVGDYAMVIQMTGAPPLADASSGIGRYELLPVTAVSGSTVTLGGIANTYEFATQAVQLIRVPNDPDVTVTGTVTAQPWDGSTGGVVSLRGGVLTLNADVDASAAGFSKRGFKSSASGDLTADTVVRPVGAPDVGAADGRGEDAPGNDPGGAGFGGGGLGGAGGVPAPFGEGIGGDVAGGRAGGQGAFGMGGADGSGTAGGEGDLGRLGAGGGGGGGGIIGGGGGGGSSKGNGQRYGGALDQIGGGGGGGGVDGGGGGGGPGAELNEDDADRGGGGGGGIGSVGAGVDGLCADSCSGSGGGSYGGGGGGGGGGRMGGDDAAGGGGGGSWSGGGAGATYTGDFGNPRQQIGGDGNEPVSTPIPESRHYLTDTQPRLMMGESGGWGSCNRGGSGGGIVLLDFDSVEGNGNAILANAEPLVPTSPTCSGMTSALSAAGGAGGGGGGQMRLTVDSWSDTTVEARGADGGAGEISESPYHGGVGGGGGGGGGIWFDTVLGYTGDETNTGGGAPQVPGITGYSVSGGAPGDFTDNPKNDRESTSGAGGGNGLIRVTTNPAPILEIEKATNSVDADSAPGVAVVEGGVVTWTYTVTVGGIGTAAGVTITDDQVAAAAISCDVDGDGTFESPNAVGAIAAPATFLCQATGLAVADAYTNTGTVVGTDSDVGTALTDDDPSNYFGRAPSITLEKQTNGVEADTDTLNDGTETTSSISDGASNPIATGAAVTWTFQITNNGAVPLTDVVIEDVTTMANAENHALTIACDWPNSSDAATAIDNLSVGETVACTATGTAGAGLHENTATVTGDAAGTQVIDADGNPVFDNNADPVFTINPDGTFTAVTDPNGDPIEVSDADASGYEGRAPSISLTKTIAGTPDGDTTAVVEGQAVNWEFVVTNTGGGALDNVVVTDPALAGATISCPQNTLAVAESITCTATSVAGAAPLTNTGEVTADPAGGGPEVSDSDDAAYAVGVPAISVNKLTCVDPGDVPATCSDGPEVPRGSPLVWYFEIENTGEVTLVDVTLADDVEASVDAAACDWASSSDAATGIGVLSVGETVTCEQTGTAELGQYDNVATTTGVPGSDDGTAFTDPGGDELPAEEATDPSSYFGSAAPAIDIEKDTNGVQADGPTDIGPVVLQGNPVNWTFVVTNNGTADLADVRVSDTVTLDNGTGADPAGVVCDWANSSDPNTPDRNLSIGETVTCTAASTAELGQYRNLSDVVGTPVADAATADPDAPVRLTDQAGADLADVVDEDPSAYLGPDASIDIEKDTNGNQADILADQDSYDTGDPIAWTFVVTNDGNVDLSDVRVTDVVTTDNGTVADPAGVVCDWANSSDTNTPARNLSVGETVTCTASSLASAGQYRNDSSVVGTPVADAQTANPDSPVALVDSVGAVLDDVVDADPSHYFGTAAPSIDIEKDTNGNQADLIGQQDLIALGEPVVWTFVVTNDGDVDLSDVRVTDVVTTDNGTAPDPAGVVCDWASSSDADTPARNLSVGETVTCSASSVASTGQYRNDSSVVGTPVADAQTSDPDSPIALTDIDGAPLADVDDADPSHYFGAANPGIEIEKDTNGFQADDGNGPLVLVGEPVTWTFVVTNSGNVRLAAITVTDIVTTDNGTIPDPAGVVCDWTNSTVVATGVGVLDPTEQVTCTASSTAAPLDYANNSSVSGQPVDLNGVPLVDDNGVVLDPVVDEDASAYFGTTASIDIEKNTNGNQADTAATQDTLAVDDPVIWTFVVENTGTADLADVRVTDVVTTDNGTAPDPNGVVCDWPNSSDANTPARNLSIGETVTCTSTSFAEAGQYRNDSSVVGTPVADAQTADPDAPERLTDALGNALEDVVDTDPSHYFGAANASIDIEKDTNGAQADAAADQLVIPAGEDVTWTFVVTNTGDVDLADVRVADAVSVDNGTLPDPGGVVCDWANSTSAATPARNLAVAESVQCTASSTAAVGAYRNDANVVGTPVADATTANPDAPVTLQDIDGADLDDVTDVDPSHYYGAADPLIDIEKDTNGVQADGLTETGPLVPVGNPVLWTYVVTNTGGTDLGDVTVTDVVTLDNGTVPDPTGVVCDWANSSDSTTAPGTLSAGETVTCTATSLAASGQYRNRASVSGNPLTSNGTPLTDEAGAPVGPVSDSDASAYFGPVASIDIEKDTNGNQADVLGDQDLYTVGDAITWTFVVTNDGNVDLSDVRVADIVTTDNSTIADPAGVDCDWVGSSDNATPPNNLSVGETVTCTAASIAAAGQYANNSTVVGVPVADAETADPDSPVRLVDEDGEGIDDVDDEDPSHYFAEPEPSIDIEKDTNGNQADVIADQDTLPVDGPVTWTFVVTNDGNTDLANVQVVDVVTIDNGTPIDPNGVVCDWVTSTDAETPAGNLSVGESLTCTSSSTAEPGQYGNDSSVIGTPVHDAVTASPTNPTPITALDGSDLDDVEDADPSHYFGDAIPAIDVEKDTNGFQADTGTGPIILAGNPVNWTFVIANTGTTDLANVTLRDAVLTDNSTAPDPAGVVCDWANSSDANTPERNLSRGETVICGAISSSELDQYQNEATVTGTPVLDAETADPDAPQRILGEDGAPLGDVSDEDVSAYFGPDQSLSIVKTVNGFDANDAASSVQVLVARPMGWVYEVVNDGNVDLANVVVTDTATIDNGTTLDGAGVVCDWANSSDPNTPPSNLSIGETVTCSATGRAAAGQYANDGNVTGVPVADAAIADPMNPTPLVDESGSELEHPQATDPAHYYATPNPILNVQKFTNLNNADVLADQDAIAVGEPVEWFIHVENIGDADLIDIDVIDVVSIENGTPVDPAGLVCDWANSTNPTTPARTLKVAEEVRCAMESFAAPGQYRNVARATGTAVVDASDPNPVLLVDFDGVPVPSIDADDPSHYYGQAAPSIDIEKATNGEQADAATDSGPLIVPGNPVVWTFELENTGDVTLGDVTVKDEVVVDNGTAVPIAGIICDWATSSVAATGEGTLDPQETVTCAAESTSMTGQYRNNAQVIGTPLGFDGSTLLAIDGATPVGDVTDEDPSAYFGPAAAIDIEKDTNGNQADQAADQDAIAVGDAVMWTFVVENTGNVDLADVQVTDVVTTDNGTTVDPNGVVCDWLASSDAATPARNLSVGETVTCASSSTAAIGQYANNATVTGTPVADATIADPDNPIRLQDADGGDLADVQDADPSHYFGEGVPAIVVEKDTNGNQADVIGDQDSIAPGDAVTWTFVVENTGNVDLADVRVTDAVTIDNGTVADPAGVVCDWATSSDDTTPDRNLSVGETVTCTSASTAVAGQYANNSTVVGTPVADAVTADPDAPVRLTNATGTDLDDVTDEDPSHYFGEVVPAIDIEKDTNGNQADTVDAQDLIAIGDPVTWTFVVTNTGNVDLADVVVTDTVTTDNGTAADPGGVVCDWANSSDAATPAGRLSVRETVTCTSASEVAAGQYANNANVVGAPVDDATLPTPTPLTDADGNDLPDVTDEDPSHYFGPIFDLALRKQLENGTNLDRITKGSTVTFAVTVFNQGNVPASGIELVEYLPDGLTLEDEDWTGQSDGSAMRTLDGLTLQPGESTTVTITARVTAPANNVELVSNSEIAAAEPVNDDGEVLQVLSAGVLTDLPDVDSVPDTVDDETAVDDEVNNEGGDEDDHDRVAIIVINPTVPTGPASTNPAPAGPGTITNPPQQPVPVVPQPVLALTGTESRALALLGLMSLLAGFGVVAFAGGVRRRHRLRKHMP